MTMDLDNFRLQYISNSNSQYSHIAGIQAALAGGCRWIQLRIKIKAMDFNKECSNLLNIASEIKNLCKDYNATFIINDFVGLVRDIGADGVHLGKNDLAPELARKLLGNNFIIGGTANTLEDIISLHNKNVDYIGLGPFRFTQTKRNLSSILGIEGYRAIFAELDKLKISVPIVAIGGITRDDVSILLKTGISGIAVSGAILSSSDPQQETIDFIKTIKGD